MPILYRGTINASANSGYQKVISVCVGTFRGHNFHKFHGDFYFHSQVILIPLSDN